MKKAKKLISALLGLCLTVSGLTAIPVNAKGIQGDIDASGKLGVTDLIALRRWLANPNEFSGWYYSTMYQWDCADLNGDGKLNVIDLALMKQKLTSNIQNLNPIFTANNLMASITAESAQGKDADENFIHNQTEFYLNLIRKTAKDGTNTLVSPYSLVQCLGMVANGADGQTLAEMQNVLGGGMLIDELNQYLYAQSENQPHQDGCKFLTSNSIWFRDDQPIAKDFLQTNANYYHADAFSVQDFGQQTVNDVNKWTASKTDNMIPHLVDAFDGSTVMALINAVTFDADWKQEYAWANEVDNWFTAYDGTKQKASVLSSSDLPYEHAEEYYLSDEHSTGFLKYYTDGRYAFAAILPEEGMTTTEYLSTLTANSLHNMLANPEHVNVRTAMPEFSYEYEVQLPEILSEMGMPNMFTGGLNRMTDGDNNYFVSTVMQKTFIDVNKKGTKAAAATMAVIAESMTFTDKEVICNRPFVYCIVDTETSLPMFIGTVETLN